MTTSTELAAPPASPNRDSVPADNMAALDTLDPQTREVAVTRMLGEARSWLAHSVEATEPVEIANFKAYIATVAESTKQLNLSKEIQLDATEMIRRAERALGLAIRKGQDEGTVSRGQGKRTDLQLGDDSTKLPSVREIAPDFYNNGMEIGRLADNFTDDEFEEAVSRAKEEGNVSRANVLRKGEEARTGAQRQADKWERIASLAAEGYTRRQIAEITGMSHEGLSAGAKREGITFPADRVVGKTRTIDTNRVISQSVAQLEGLAMALDLINPDDIDPERAQEWSDSLTQSIRALRKAHNQIKESLS